MPNQRAYTRIPPSSTGNRINIKHTAFVPYSNKIGSFIINSMVYLQSSGWTMHVHGENPLDATTGYLEVHYARDAEFQELTPVAGENILTMQGGAIIAQVHPSLAIEDVYFNTNHILSYDNPDYGLYVDAAGSANIRFAEGVPQLDAFGKLRVSGANQLGGYLFATGQELSEFSQTTLGNATITWDQQTRGVSIETNGGVDDFAAFTSHTYHHYVPGSSHLFMGALAVFGFNQNNLELSWGTFDSKNGFGFMTQNGVLGVFIRSNTSGSVVTQFIPQSQWNIDRVDGSSGALNVSNMNLNISRDNIYWLDVQWHGAGRVRFGTWYDGRRIVCHEYYHSNNYPYPISATCSLPVCCSVKNSGAGLANAEIRMWTGSVWTETSIDISKLGRPQLYTGEMKMLTSTSNTYIYSLSPSEFLPNGDVNHSLYYPTTFSATAWDMTTGQQALVAVEIILEPVLSTESWSLIPGSVVDVETTSTFYGAGKELYHEMFFGFVEFDFTKIFNNMQYGAVKNYADDGGTVTDTIVNISNASPAVITINAPRWNNREYRSQTITGVSGMTEINGQEVYIKITGLTTAELYQDAARTIPVDTTTYGTYTTGGTIKGFFGSRFRWSVIARKVGPNPNNVMIMIHQGWKEITQ